MNGAQGSYQAFPDDPDKVRIPDVSFTRRERLPIDGPAEGHARVAPDLVVEDEPMSTPLDLPEDLFVCIDHVGVAVPDLDAAIELYTTVFGMTVAHREVNEEQRVEEAMVQISRGSGDDDVIGTQRIQLLAPLNDESTIAKFLERSGPGLQQLAYRVTDVEKVSAILRERGMRLLYDAPKRGTANSRINFIHPKDAGGVLVELVEPAADAH